MTVLLIILHITVCIALIAVVLLQSGKGAEMGASFGASGSQSVFGAGGGSIVWLDRGGALQVGPAKPTSEARPQAPAWRCSARHGANSSHSPRSRKSCLT